MLTYDVLAPLPEQERQALFARLRAEPGLCRIAPLGAYGAARHEDALALLKDSRTFSSEALAVTAAPPWLGPNPVAESLLTKDPPEHARLRALVSRAFGASGIARLEARVREVSERWADTAVRQGEGDLVEAFTHRVPRDIIGEMLGLEADTFPRFQRWSQGMAAITAAITPAQQEECRAVVREMDAALRAVIAARRRQPADDMVSDLLAAEVEGRTLSDDEVLAFLFLLLPAGMDTTTQWLGNAVLTLARRPEELARARADKAHVARFLEEVLRYEPPSQLSFRLATRDTELAGTRIPAGSLVLGLIASANRDERVFDQPEHFLPGRSKATQHLTFGHGIHFCLGAQLARLEARIALETLVSRVRGLEPLSPTVEWIPSLASHGPASLPLRLVPA
ncbi:cytochrome P450 [Melittangium boletus]|uniref:cytochrome P450 n=1 Tax=Melittangium boletus TaxID=83453 RepID=UPI003DA60CE8